VDGWRREYLKRSLSTGDGLLDETIRGEKELRRREE